MPGKNILEYFVLNANKNYIIRFFFDNFRFNFTLLYMFWRSAVRIAANYIMHINFFQTFLSIQSDKLKKTQSLLWTSLFNWSKRSINYFVKKKTLHLHRTCDWCKCKHMLNYWLTMVLGNIVSSTNHISFNSLNSSDRLTFLSSSRLKP